ISLTLRQPENNRLRTEVLDELQYLIARADESTVAYPFNYCQNMKPRGGVIAAGNVNLMKAGYVLLGGTRKEIVESFHRGSKELFDAFSSSPQPLLASFSFLSERWAVDNACAVESLRWHDKLFGSQYSAATERYKKLLASFIDEKSGMMN